MVPNPPGWREILHRSDSAIVLGATSSLAFPGVVAEHAKVDHGQRRTHVAHLQDTSGSGHSSYADKRRDQGRQLDFGLGLL